MLNNTNTVLQNNQLSIDREFASKARDPEFDSGLGHIKKLQKIGIYSFLIGTPYKGQCEDKAGKFPCCVLGKNT